MSDEHFTEPDNTRDEWVDVRMTDPEEGEWDVDMVVVGGNVEYVDLRIRPELLTEFVDCLADDVGEDRVESLMENLARHTSEDQGDTEAAETEE